MKLLLENWRQYINESKFAAQYLRKLEAGGVVPGAIVHDHEFSEERPLIIRIEKVDENGVSWNDELGGGRIDLYTAIEALNSNDWRPSGQTSLPNYFRNVDAPKSKRLDFLNELFYGTSTALQETLAEEGIPAPSVWGDYALAEKNAYLVVKEHGGELMVINVPMSDFDKSKFVMEEEKGTELVYSETLELKMQEINRSLLK